VVRLGWLSRLKPALLAHLLPCLDAATTTAPETPQHHRTSKVTPQLVHKGPRGSITGTALYCSSRGRSLLQHSPFEPLDTAGAVCGWALKSPVHDSKAQTTGINITSTTTCAPTAGGCRSPTSLSTQRSTSYPSTPSLVDMHWQAWIIHKHRGSNQGGSTALQDYQCCSTISLLKLPRRDT